MVRKKGDLYRVAKQTVSLRSNTQDTIWSTFAAGIAGDQPNADKSLESTVICNKA